MSIKKLFQENKTGKVVSNYLKNTSTADVGGGVESAGHLSESLKKELQFVPSLDYGDPKAFAKFGSAEKYYENAFSYTVNNYPYDGSGYEKTKFYNDLNPLGKYVFDNKYPKSTGFVEIGTGYGTATSGTSHYFSASKEEYIQIQGGPHSGTVFSTASYRTNNLEFGGPSGSTVEFFLSKSAIPGTQSPKQVILDVWNGIPSGTLAAPATNYGRLTIELNKSAEDRFYVTLVSGAQSNRAIGYMTQSIPTTGGIGDYITGGWNQYSFVFNTDTSSPTIDFYINGTCHETGITILPGATENAQIQKVTGSLLANLGALRTAPSGTDGRDDPAVQEGYGKLSGSIDEFRFWKKARNGEEIGRHWFTDVDGGSNKYDANVDLGVYYKFNEGITNTSSVDRIVLDYSGRISNANWVGYTASVYSPRNTGSAIDLMNLTSKTEPPTPIVRPGNPLYSSTLNDLKILGQSHDYQNNSWLMNSFPDWIIEEDSNNKELAALTQIMSSYFDTLSAQVSEIPKIKNLKYLSGSATGSINEFPHNDRLVENLGIELGSLFQEAGAMQNLLGRDENIIFQQKLEDIKNTIYRNLYNNLQDILKSKGTEKAFRNVLRCFGIDENIISLNVYGNHGDYDLETNYRSGISNKKYIDFSGLSDASSSAATVFQYHDSSVTGSSGIISGSSDPTAGCPELEQSAFTIECEAIFPPNSDGYRVVNPNSRTVISSLFGWHTTDGSDFEEAETTWTGSAELDWGLQVYAIKSPSHYSDSNTDLALLSDAYFKVTNRSGDLVLTSPVYPGVYDDQKWNFSVGIRPSKYGIVSGAAPWADALTNYSSSEAAQPYGTAWTPTRPVSYVVEFYGVNYDTGVKRDSFYVTSSLTGTANIKNAMSYFSGSTMIISQKRLYMGAHRENFTGTLLQSSDAKISSLRYWTDRIPTGTVDLHAREVDSWGRVNPYKEAYEWQWDSPNVFVPKIETLALNWDFATVTGSDTSGEFTVVDFSSGSNVLSAVEVYASGGQSAFHQYAPGLPGAPSGAAAAYDATLPLRQGALYGRLNLVKHPGKGAFFSATGTPAKKEFVYADKKVLPEYATSNDMINILDSDINVFGTNLRPTSYYFSVEKSMYQGISNSMLELFASIDEMNNLIGEPINRYRPNYKSMEKIREIFFRRVGNVPDLEKYLEYYKWIDSSIGQVLEQLFPASAKYATGVRTMIESHVLERPKIRHHFIGPQKYTRNENGIEAQGDIRTPPIPFPQNPQQAGGASNKNRIGNFQGFGKFKLAPIPATPGAEQSEGEHSYWWKYQADRNNLTISSSNPGIMATRQAIFQQAKNYPNLSASAYRFNASRDSSLLLDIGVNSFKTNKIARDNPGLIGLSFGSFKPDKYSTDIIIPNLKNTRMYSSSFGGTNYKGELLTPFTAISSTITNGYQTELVAQGLNNVDFANLHTRPRALQGPFTVAHVGGLQARSVPPLSPAGSDVSSYVRKESFDLSIADGAGSFSLHETTEVPKGQYTNQMGVSSPVNIQNIKTSGSALEPHGGVLLLTGGVNIIGNYSKNYEVVFTQDRAATNIDFAFNNQNYYTSSLSSGSMPSAFLTPPNMRSLNRSGTVDYNNPRELGTARKSKSILAQRFAAPGSKKDSKAQFRDVPSDQFSPNNVLPFRNIPVREDLQKDLTQHTSWGGFTGSYQTILDVYGANTNQGLKAVSALDLLNSGVQRFGFSSGSIYLSSATFSNGETLTLTLDGYTYSAELDNSVSPGSSDANTIGINGLSSGGSDAQFAVAVMYSLTDWSYQSAGTLVVPVSVGAQIASAPIRVYIYRLTHGSSEDGTAFGGSLVGNSGISFGAFSGDGLQQIPGSVSYYGYLSGGINPHNQTQRNTTKRIKLYDNLGSWADGTTTYYTASSYDNSYVVRPIPQADRSKWFISLSGSASTMEPSGGVSYQEYVMSGSRYPSNITFVSSTLDDAGTKATGVIYIESYDAATIGGSEIEMTDAAGSAMNFEADSTQALNNYTRVSDSNYTYGISGGSSNTDVATSLFMAMSAAVSAGDISLEEITVVSLPSDGVTFSQTVEGIVGNTTITITGGSGKIQVSGFTGGAAPKPLPFGNSVYTGSSGKTKFLWSRQKGESPWRQTRAGEGTFGSYQRLNNVYEFPLASKTLGSLTVEKITGKKNEIISKKSNRYINYSSSVGDNSPLVGARTYKDQAGNMITSSYSQRFIEPPVTSKYKPIVHKIGSVRGTPSRTDYDKKVDITLNYSYGNDLLGFANPGLNVKTKNNPKFRFGDIRRPYEIIRDNRIQKVPATTTGLEIVKGMFYSETIYPKAVYTYLSGTRQRLAFVNEFWRPDNIPRVTSTPNYGSPAANFFENEEVLKLVNRQWSRNKMGALPLRAASRISDGESTPSGSFRTSQGYETRWDEQFPTGTLDINTGTLDPTEGHRLGTGSMWPLDSHYFSTTPISISPRIQGANFSSVTVLTKPDGHDGRTRTIYAKIYNAMTTTMPAGELMMPQYGRIMSGAAPNDQPSGSPPVPSPDKPVSAMGSGGIRYGTSSLNSAMYAYSTPTEALVTEDGGTNYKWVALPRSPGGYLSFPYWSAPYTRKYVDGPKRGLPTDERYPFYKSYDDWSSDIRATSKDKTIIPEFRISSHIIQMKETNSSFTPLSSAFELTGVFNATTASVGNDKNTEPTGADSRNPDFMPRYGTTDVITFLEPFMSMNSADLESNKSPRHFKIESDATLKLLPYEGFYPVLRSLEIATLFSKSYSEQTIFGETLDAGGYASPSASSPARWRSMTRPFFAPGILYNSIKAGTALQYPVLRAGVVTGSGGFFNPTLVSHSIAAPLMGPLSASIGNTAGRIPGGRRRRNIGAASGNFDWSDPDVASFFWPDVIPFEGILKPLKYVSDQNKPLVLADINKTMYMDVSASVRLSGNRDSGERKDTLKSDDTLYRLAISNYLAAIPEFFLKERPEGGYLTKFVAEIPRKAQPGPAGIEASSQNEARTVSVNRRSAYVMEIGLKKTDRYNLYNNPYAFGMPTATGSSDWNILGAGSGISGKHLVTASFSQTGGLPPGRSWPEHRGEFAPFTPTYYYGPSIARLTYLPNVSGEVTLSNIFENITVEYVNENGYFYDFDSGSYMDPTGTVVSTSGTPLYGWNRAWQNRQDLDATVVIDNSFPTEGSDNLSPLDPNKWVIMPKWECPALDHPGPPNSMQTDYAYSSSVRPGGFNKSTSGQWHDYGTMPSSSEGIFLYISDVTSETTEYRLLGNPTGSDPTSGVATGGGLIQSVKKVSKEVFDSGRTISSLATLVGFKDEEIMPAGQWVPTRAKRIGELGENEEKSISEAIVAMPFYFDGKTGKTEAMTLRANPSELGPKIKEFRRAFTKYSFPPSMKKSLWKLLPPDFPSVSNYINPFESGSEDDYNAMLRSKKEISVPVMYLLEHTISLTRQDLADIWQGLLPEIGTTMSVDMTAIDHYMPGEDAGPIERTVFPEILQKEIELGMPRNGHPRVDLLDTTIFKDKNSFNPEIKWLVFKVKQQGMSSYSELIFNEINGGADARSYNNIFGAISKNLPDDERRRMEKIKSIYTKNLYLSEELGKSFNSFNWPYDYCSLIESAKLTTTTGFRPDLKKEVSESIEGLEGIEPMSAQDNPFILPPPPVAMPIIAPNIIPQLQVTPAPAPVRLGKLRAQNASPMRQPIEPANVLRQPVLAPKRAPLRNFTPAAKNIKVNANAIKAAPKNNKGRGGFKY